RRTLRAAVAAPHTAFACGDLVHGSSARDRRHRFIDDIVVWIGVLVAMLEQQPLCATTFTTHPHQDPSTFEPLAVEHDFQISALVTFSKRLHSTAPFGLVRSAVQQHDGAAAILSLRN